MANEVVIDLEIDAGQSVKTIAGLEAERDRLTKKMKETGVVGTKAFDDMAAEIQKVSSEIKTLEKQFEGLEPQQVADSFVLAGEGIVGAFTAATGAAALFGESSEAVQEQMLKVEAAISIALGARAIAEGIVQGKIAATTARRWLATKAQKAELVATKALNFAQKVFSGNLKGAVKDGKNFVKGLKNIKSGVGLAVTAVLAIGVALFEYISGLNAAKKAQADFEQGLKDIDTASKERVKTLSRELSVLKAKGIEEVKQANLTEEITKEQIKGTDAKIKQIEEERAALEDIIGVKTVNGKVDEEAVQARLVSVGLFSEEAKEIKKASDALNIFNESEETSVKSTEALKDELFALNTQLIENGIAITEVEEGITKKQQDEYNKRATDRQKALEQRNKEIADANKQLIDLQNKQITDERERQIAESNTTFDRRLETIKGNSETETQLRIAIEKQRGIEIAAINKDFNQREIDAEREQIEKLKEIRAVEAENEEARRTAKIDRRASQLEADLIQLELDGLSTIEKQREIAKAERDAILSEQNVTIEQVKLAQANFRKAEAELDAQAAQQKIDIENKKREAVTGVAADTIKTLGSLNTLFTKDAEKQEKIQKKLAVVQLGIDTAKSISSTIAGASAAAAAGGPAAPFLLAGYIATGLATVFGAFSQAKGILGEGGAEPTGGVQGGSPQQAPPVFEAISGPVTQINSPELAVKAFVVEEDITESQDKVKDFENQATFG